MNEISYGVNTLELDLAGKTIEELRGIYAPIFQIPEDAVAYLNGEEVEDFEVLESGDTLEFIKTAGGKGA